MSLEQTIAQRRAELTPWVKTKDDIIVPGKRPVHEKTFKGENRTFGGIGNYGDANVIVPVIKESDGTYRKAVLTAQFRPGPERFLFEFPGGNVKGGESATGAAIRELAEEAGVLPTKLISLGNVRAPTPRDAYQEGTIQGFLALGSTKAGEQSLDAEEAEQGLFTVVASIGDIAELMYGGNTMNPGLEYHTSLPSAVAFERAMLYMLPRGLLCEEAREGIIAAQERHYETLLDLERAV